MEGMNQNSDKKQLKKNRVSGISGLASTFSGDMPDCFTHLLVSIRFSLPGVVLVRPKTNTSCKQLIEVHCSTYP